MKRIRVVNPTRGTVLGSRIRLADRWWRRLRGLLGVGALAEGEGMLLSPCTAVHTVAMRFPLDVAFLDEAGRVVAVYPSLPPNRFTRRHRAARFALELPAGALGETCLDDELAWEVVPG